MARGNVKARYAKRLDQLIERGDRLNEQELRKLYRKLDRTRKDLREMLTNEPTEWTQARYAPLKQRVESLMAQTGRELGLDLRELESTRWDQGKQWTDDMLRDFGGEIALADVPLDRRMLSMLSDYSAELVTDVSRKVIDDTTGAIQRGIMAQKTPYDIMQEIAGKLVDKNGNPLPGVFGDALRRAEVIYQTESGRVFSTAEQSRMKQWDEERPGLLKTWKHGHASIAPRPSHLDAEARYSPGGNPGPIPFDEPFVLRVGSGEASKGLPAGEYELMFPRDPAAPAGLTVSCRCGHGPWREGWED